MKPKSNRIAVVTGANRGLGLETCRALLGLGLRVVMTGRDEADLERARKGIRDAASNPIAVRMDVTDPESIRSAHRTIVAEVGPVDVLVNNAAILLQESTSVLSIPKSAFRQTFDTNLFGVVEVCRAFVPSMAERRYGRVVNSPLARDSLRACPPTRLRTRCPKPH
jgi:NAD(P)-dependent dehydrogenase (short-subunit alcohol dehydrogenase family)